MINLAALVDVLTKDQIGQFLQLRGTTKTGKGELAQKLLTLLAEDELAKDRFFEAFKRELAVPPWEVEAMLGCTAAERKRWVADGKLPILEYRTFHKVARDLPYPVHDRRIIADLSRDTIQRWRAEHQALVRLRRKTGVRKAAESREAHQQSRRTFRQQWEAIVATWKEHGSPELAAVLQLAYWTVWASRWAKENHLKRQGAIKHAATYQQRGDAWYARKNDAMRWLSRTPYARLAFYRPEEPDKLSLNLCSSHYEMKRELHYESKWDFYADYRPEVRRCAKCYVSEERDFYSLYYLEVRAEAFPDLCFAFHMPYPIGKAFWPTPQRLPQVDHLEQDGLFRFGRALLADEKIIYREQDVLNHFEAALEAIRQFYSQES
jgi:hypothetical protein